MLQELTLRSGESEDGAGRFQFGPAPEKLDDVDRSPHVHLDLSGQYHLVDRPVLDGVEGIDHHRAEGLIRQERQNPRPGRSGSAWFRRPDHPLQQRGAQPVDGAREIVTFVGHHGQPLGAVAVTSVGDRGHGDERVG